MVTGLLAGPGGTPGRWGSAVVEEAVQKVAIMPGWELMYGMLTAHTELAGKAGSLVKLRDRLGWTM